MMHTHIEVIAGGRPGPAIRLESQGGAEIRLVLVGGVQIEFIYARLARLKSKMVPGIEVELVRLLREARGGSAPDTVEDIVVKLAIPINGRAGAGSGVGGGD